MRLQVIVILFFALVVTAEGRVRCAAEEAEWKSGGEAFSVDVVRPQWGWVTRERVDPASWNPAEQPDLAQQLAGAPQLELEVVAPPPERCWLGQRPYLVPNPGGKSWDMVFPYYNTYGGEQEVVIHDFGTGNTRKQILSTRRGDSVLTRERIDFHMQPSFYTDGKLIFEMYGPVIFLVFDPAKDAFVLGVKPFGDEVINGRCVLGDDGMIYGIGWPKDKSGFVAYQFDPTTGESKRYKTFGPLNERRRELYREVVMCGNWLYAAVGAEPWHLVAFNFKTGEGRLLAATEAIIGDHNTIGMSRMQGGVSGYIRQPAMIAHTEDFDRHEFTFWLHEGGIYARESDVPPWSDLPAQSEARRRFDWAREFQVWPRDFTPPSPPPEIPAGSGAPAPSGRVELPYHMSERKEDQTLEYHVKMYPGEVNLLTEVNDHILFATDSGYGQHVFYDLTQRTIRRIGGTVSPYSFGFLGDRLYVSGYPGSQMVEYDFGRPLGLVQENPNPKRLGHPASDTHIPLGGTVGGADGRVYNGGTTAGRRRIGGGLGWYDTQTGALGGMPLADHRIFWMTSAADGRYVVLSSKCEGQGLLFIWDTQSHDFQDKVVPPEGAAQPGPVVEALPGLVIGHTVGGNEEPFLYGFDPASSTIVWTKPVPSPPVTAFSLVRRQAYSFRRGPDGLIWSFFGNVLVRIDPRTVRVEAVGCLPAGARPGQLAFAQGKVFLAGGPCLRRIVLPQGYQRH